MRIGIDASGLTVKSGGIGRYVVNLINHMAWATSRDESHELLVFYHKSFDRSLIHKHPHLIFVDTLARIKSNVLRKGLFLPFVAKKQNLDLFHGVDHIGIPFFFKRGKCRFVLTVHDLITKLFPEMFTLKHRMIENTLRPLILRNADRIIAVSRSTRDDLLRFYPQYADKTRVIYQGVDTRFFPRDREEIKKIQKKYRIDFPYILSLGTLEPRKNIPRLVEGFAKAKMEGGIEHKLVVTGRKGWKYKEMLSQLQEGPFSEEIVFTGFVEDEDLPCLYAGAEIFLYLSLYEGFGLPVLEAMACETPVITSNLSSLPEVAGDAALLIDSSSAEEIAASLLRLLSDEELRKDLQKKGRERAKFFSWEKTAEEILELYEEILT